MRRESLSFLIYRLKTNNVFLICPVTIIAGHIEVMEIQHFFMWCINFLGDKSLLMRNITLDNYIRFHLFCFK